MRASVSQRRSYAYLCINGSSTNEVIILKKFSYFYDCFLTGWGCSNFSLYSTIRDYKISSHLRSVVQKNNAFRTVRETHLCDNIEELVWLNLNKQFEFFLTYEQQCRILNTRTKLCFWMKNMKNFTTGTFWVCFRISVTTLKPFAWSHYISVIELLHFCPPKVSEHSMFALSFKKQLLIFLTQNFNYTYLSKLLSPFFEPFNSLSVKVHYKHLVLVCVTPCAQNESHSFSLKFIQRSTSTIN